MSFAAKVCFALLFCVLGSGQAQVFFGPRLDLVAYPSPAPMLGGQVGAEFGSGSIGAGVRLSASTLLVISRAALDGYISVPVEAGSSVYLGGGLGYIPQLAAGPDGFAVASGEIHGLIGYQWQETAGRRWFFEVAPILAKSSVWVVAAVGINFY